MDCQAINNHPSLIKLQILKDCLNTKSIKLSRKNCHHFAPWRNTTMVPFEMTHSFDQAPQLGIILCKV